MRRIIGILSFLLLVNWVAGATYLPFTPQEHADASDAICIATVSDLQTARNRATGQVWTRVLISVNYTLKGKFSRDAYLYYRGGFSGDDGEYDSRAPTLKVGDVRMFFLKLDKKDNTLAPTYGFPSVGEVAQPTGSLGRRGIYLTRQGYGLLLEINKHNLKNGLSGLDVSGQGTVPNSDENKKDGNVITPKVGPGSEFSPSSANGKGSRLITADRGEPIPYVVDLFNPNNLDDATSNLLPTGISREQALTAVSNALAAWSAVTSLKFRFDGLQRFGQSASTFSADEEILRIQLHDFYNDINDGSTTLGIGGRFFQTNSADFPQGSVSGLGGVVNGLAFNWTTDAYLVLEPTRSFFANEPLNLEQVLTHEIGHSLGLAHSSENSGETDGFLSGAIMYFLADNDSNRGSALGSYDSGAMRLGYPTDNLPPFGFSRFVTIITSFSALSNPEVNQITLPFIDLDGDSVTASFHDLSAGTGPHTTFVSGNGTFTLNGNKVSFAPAGAFGDSILTNQQIIGGTSFDSAFVTLTDTANNTSAAMQIKVIGFAFDGNTSAADGLPDSWISDFSGIGGVNDDFDKDGLSNFEEYLDGTDPTDPNSRFGLSSFDGNTISWRANEFLLYELQKSSDLVNWERVESFLPRSETGTAKIPAAAGTPSEFYRIIRHR